MAANTKPADKTFKFAIITLVMSLIFTLTPSVEAAAMATCSGSGCEALNPNSTGCDSGASTLRSFTGTGYKVELRQAGAGTGCNTKWTRTQNTSSISLYAGARYWVHAHYLSSPAPISPLARIYTHMHWPANETYMYCGKTNTSPIGQPMTSPCQGPA